jgi:tripartite-type tricarboxylate transporter receptor subunit TctC
MNQGWKLAAPIALAAAAVFSTGAVAAEAYPDKPVRIIVPFSTGGGTDIQGRLLAGKMQQNTGKTFIIDNRTGAGGLIGAQITVESANDGYTLLFTTATLAVNTTLQAKRMKFSATTDLDPITWISSSPLVLGVHPSVPVKSAKELIEMVKQRPGVFNVAGNTPGSTSHLAAELLKQAAGLKYAVILYRGGGPATLAAATGEVDFIFTTAPSIQPHIRANRLKALAVTTPKPSSGFPGVPTLNTIYPTMEIDNWYAMFFPKGTSSDKVDYINREAKKALNADDVKAFYDREGLIAVGSTPAELATKLNKEIKLYADIIKKGGIKM